MGGKYSVYARNYKSPFWEAHGYTDSIIKAIKMLVTALAKYELVEFTVRKEKKEK